MSGQATALHTDGMDPQLGRTPDNTRVLPNLEIVWEVLSVRTVPIRTEEAKMGVLPMWPCLWNMKNYISAAFMIATIPGPQIGETAVVYLCIPLQKTFQMSHT